MRSGRGTLGLWLRPRMWGLHAIAALAVVVCLVGGTWQLGAYDARQEHERADRRDVPTVPIAEAWDVGDPFNSTLNHRPVTVTGEFGAEEEHRWVTGRTQDGDPGFWLLAPLTISGTDQAILVVRGFATTTDAIAPPPSGVVTVRVILEPGEPVSPDDATRTAGSPEISAVRVPTLVNELPYALFPGFGISTDDATAGGGLVLADIPSPDVEWTVGLRNLAYSLQWWAFGAFALFMWVRMGKDMVADERARTADNLSE